MSAALLRPGWCGWRAARRGGPPRWSTQWLASPAVLGAGGAHQPGGATQPDPLGPLVGPQRGRERVQEPVRGGPVGSPEGVPDLAAAEEESGGVGRVPAE